VARGGNLMVRKEKPLDERTDKKGITRTENHWEKSRLGDTIDYNGTLIPKYVTKNIEVVYKGKWIVGTDFMYDYGLATNMKRGLKNKAATELSYHLKAYQYKNLTAVGMMERIIPIIDEYQETIYRIQNFKNKWLPYIVDIDLESLESVALGDGGKNMTPKQLLDMVYQNFTLVSRRSNLAGNNINYKAVDVRPTGMHQEYSVLVSDLSRLLMEMRDILGFNEVTDGSSPNPNLLNYVASLGAEATNNALRPLMEADKTLGLMLARGLILRLVQVVKSKKVEGLLPALGQESMKFVSVSPDTALHDWGIMIEDKPTLEERNLLLQQITGKEQAGMIDPEDYTIIMQTQNLKQARALLAYRAKKRRKEEEAYALQKMQMNGQVQQQSAIAAEQAKQQTLQLEYELKMQLEMAKKEKDIEMVKIKQFNNPLVKN
jgi:hypothetical protein